MMISVSLAAIIVSRHAKPSPIALTNPSSESGATPTTQSLAAKANSQHHTRALTKSELQHRSTHTFETGGAALAPGEAWWLGDDQEGGARTCRRPEEPRCLLRPRLRSLALFDLMLLDLMSGGVCWPEERGLSSSEGPSSPISSLSVSSSFSW